MRRAGPVMGLRSVARAGASSATSTTEASAETRMLNATRLPAGKVPASPTGLSCASASTLKTLSVPRAGAGRSQRGSSHTPA